VNNIFDLAADCLFVESVDAKLATTDAACKLLHENQLKFCTHTKPKSIDLTVFPSQPSLVEPRSLPRRGLATEKGRAALLHSIAHIEFYAIHLAWDIIYRFRDQPEEFYRDWLKVAGEEALHFKMIRQRLHDFDIDYGEFAAHKGLWDIAVLTSDDLLARLALVPRTMEARGLDVTPGMIEKLKQVNDSTSVRVLERILRDEIGHVAIGSRWFRSICSAQGLNADETYISYVKALFNGKIRMPINFDLRKQAGFSETELQSLLALE